MIEEIEAAIVARVSAPLLEVGCRLRNAPLTGLPKTKSDALLFCSGRSAEGNSAGRSRVMRLSFTVNVFVKDLQDHKSAYAPLETLLELLDGFRPLEREQGKLSFQSENYVTVDLGDGFRWHYEQNYSIQVMWMGMRT